MSDLADSELLSLVMQHQISSARGGRKTKSDPGFTLVRELGAGDLELIANPPPVQSTTTSVKELRAAHHHLARTLARGASNAEASAITGYSPSRISILKSDPAFRELVTYYTTQVTDLFMEAHAQLAGIGLTAVQELQSRLDSEPTAFSHRELMEVAQLGLDRSIAPPKGAKGGAQNPQVMPTFNIQFVTPTDAKPAVTIDHNPAEN